MDTDSKDTPESTEGEWEARYAKKANNGFRYPTWAGLVAVVVFVAAVSGWFVNYGGQREQVQHLRDQLGDLSERIKEVERWQRDWPTEGELIMDRAQNTKLDDLFRRVNKLENRGS